jgi:sRNA-binding carbon storage regulator CsrA
MPDQTLQVGEVLLLGGDIRLTVLAIEGDTIFFGVDSPAAAPVGSEETPEEWGLWQSAFATYPSRN